MATMDDRRKALEEKYFHDEDRRFKINSRRRKLLGLWAAAQLHLDEAEAKDYAIEIVKLGTTDSTEGAVVRKIVTDFAHRGISLNEEDIRQEMEICEANAVKQLAAENPAT